MRFRPTWASARRLLVAYLASLAAGQACEQCRLSYFNGMEAAPKASALHPEAKVVAYTLEIGERTASPAGRPARTLTINGGTPGPVLRFREGDVARITVRNTFADEDASIHWHGLLVPNLEDGVPGLTTPRIAPGGSRVFEFLIKQSGTYWYHSHTGLQLQGGVFGAIVIEPKDAVPAADRVDHDVAILLSDWTDESPREVQRTLLRGSDWYAFRRGTAQSLLGAYRAGKLDDYLGRERARVPAMDLSDVAFDAFLMNGRRSLHLPGKPGERVRVRLVNASAATYFYLESALGPLRVTHADGQAVTPFGQNRLLIAPAENYDLVVRIPAEGAWDLRATAQDGSGSVSAWWGEGVPHPTPAPPKPDPYGMNDYLRSILDQLDPEPGATEPARPLSPYGKFRAARPHPVPVAHRDLTLKLTGDMMRYEWTFDGTLPAAADILRLKAGEALRIRLVNNTMMHHPIHFHGHFFRLVDQDGTDPATAPLKHTLDVPPMSVRTIEFTADEGTGDWLLHCHLLYHHTSGMMRVIRVTAADGAEPPHAPALHQMETGLAWGEASFLSHHAFGFATYQEGRNNWTVGWDVGATRHAGHEVEATYERTLDGRLGVFAGYRFDAMDGGIDGLLAGVAYRLPYFIEARLSRQSGGETRLGLMKSLALTDRLGLDLSVQKGTLTGTASSAHLRYRLTKETSLTGGWSSDFGLGAGITVRF
jgi:FtsP/CotA-like multicopper oxidase with cupredoxin domain